MSRGPEAITSMTPLRGPAESPLPWRELLSEFIGTALLVLGGLSLVIVMFGSGSPIPAIIPGKGVRRVITGFLFGSIGASIALSPIGKVSGAHINPVVTLGFRLMGKIDRRRALGFIAAQFLGAVLGSLPLLLWGGMGKSVSYGASLPDPDFPILRVFASEVVATMLLVSLLAVFLGFRGLRRFTPAVIPPLYALMGWVEGPISGSSTNPARSLGPAIVSGQWQGWWIYWLGPLLGMLIALIFFSFMAKRIEVAKLYHFESDHRRFFRTKTPVLETEGDEEHGTKVQ